MPPSSAGRPRRHGELRRSRQEDVILASDQRAVGTDERDCRAADDHERIDRGDERDHRRIGHRAEGHLGRCRLREGPRDGAQVGLEVGGPGQGHAVENDAGDRRSQRIVVEPDGDERRLHEDRLLQLRAKTAQDQVVEAAVGDRRDDVVHVGARHRQVAIGLRQEEVGRRAGAGGGHDQGRQTSELQDRRHAGLRHRRLLETGEGAVGLTVEVGRVAVLLDLVDEAAAGKASAEAVADRHVAAQVLGAGGQGHQGQREQDESSCRCSHDVPTSQKRMLPPSSTMVNS